MNLLDENGFLKAHLFSSNGLESIVKKVMFSLICLLFCFSTVVWFLELEFFQVTIEAIGSLLSPDERLDAINTRGVSLEIPLRAGYLSTVSSTFWCL